MKIKCFCRILVLRSYKLKWGLDLLGPIAADILIQHYTTWYIQLDYTYSFRTSKSLYL